MSKTRITANIHLNVDTLPQMLAAIVALEHREILVGVPEEKTRRKPEKSKNGKTPAEAPTNAELAYIHDKGSPARNIPARPFMEPGIRAAQPQIEKAMRLAAEAALSGDQSGVDVNLDKAGLVAVNEIRNQIRTGDFVPLSPKTLKARKRRGRTGSKPLQDTGQMRNAITYVKRNRS